MKDSSRARKKYSPELRQNPNLHQESVDVNSELSWTPELFGPVFKNEKISLRQALQTHLTDRRTKLMATFVPDELIYALDLTKKNFREFTAVLLLVDISAFNSLWERFCCAENHGSNGFSSILNSYISIMVEDIYSTEGDIITISAQGVLAMWKVRKDDFFAKTINTVVECALHLQNVIEDFGDGSKSLMKVKMTISSGVVTFSVIGNEEHRDFVVVGEPVTEVRMAKKNCVSGDVVLTESAFAHVTTESYDYVFRDPYNVKIIKIKDHSSKFYEMQGPDIAAPADKSSCAYQRISTPNASICKQDFYTSNYRISNVSMLNPSMEESELERKIFTGRFSMAEATRRKLGTHLKSFTNHPVLRQIEKDLPMEHLTETRRVTIVVINLKMTNSSVHELISLIDECYILLYSVVSDHFGCVNAITINARDVQFFVVFGLQPSSTTDNYSINGILSSMKSVRALKCIPGIQGMSVGISTGMVYCGIIGHAERMEYVILGPSIGKAIAIMRISSDKISCEFDTIFYSRLPRKKFRSRGMKELKGFGRCHLYELIDERSTGEGPGNVNNRDYVYPILGRVQELDTLTDILDDICASNRSYSGFLIEGPSRIGKSRLLDEFGNIAKMRQISMHKFCLHQADASKPYAAVYDLLLDLLGVSDGKTIEERERAVTGNLCSVIPWTDFCYLNIMMRVTFPLSMKYHSDSEEERIARSLIIFDAIVESLRGPHCIIFDDVQFMDSMSWQFISRSVNISNIVLAMATQHVKISTTFNESNTAIGSNEMIFRYKLQTLELKHMSSLVCHFLNVQAIPRKLDQIIKTRSGSDPGWCEAFLSLLIQKEALDVLSLSSDEALGKDLIFPPPESILKIQSDLSPEDVTSEFAWSRDKTNLTVCLTNNKFTEDIDSVLDTEGIRREIYDKLTSYEQTLLQCAATLGNVFTRSMLQNILPNATTLHTAFAVSRMINARILECASNHRQDFQSDDINLCMHKNRSTFSDMQHVLKCSCTPSNVKTIRNLPHYSHCRLLEFKVSAMKDFVIEQMTVSQSKEYHLKAAEIYERDARKCTACGGGPFVRIPGREKPITTEKPRISHTRQKMSLDGLSASKPKKRSFLSISNDELRAQSSEMEIRRISIMPTYYESDDEDSTTSLNAMKIVARVRTASGISDADESARLRKNVLSRYHEAGHDPSRISHLRNFSHIDFRNCQCSDIVNCLFWKFHQHLMVIGNIERLVRFLIDYNAGLIQTGQSFHAMRMLAAANETNELSSVDVRLPNIKPEDRRINRGAILALMGDACMNLGNLPQAKRYYTEAVRLGFNKNHAFNKICVPYRTFDEACKHRLYQRYPDFFVNRVTGSCVTTKLSAALYLTRLSLVLLKEGQSASSQLAALQSFNIGFSCAGSFLEKCDIYQKIARIFRDLDNLSFARRLENPMIYTIRSKHWWSDAEEVTAVANVFRTMFEIRLLHGEYEEALLMGTAVLKISGALKMTRTKLTILPQLIQLTIRTKRIHETVDLMRELKYSAPEDVDETSVTWYYALCADLALDAGMILETFETCVEYAKKITVGPKSGACVSRDPQCLRLLLTCLWIWQLRMGVSITENFEQTSKSYTRDIRADNFCHVLTLAKALECYLLILMGCINMKRADQLAPLMDDIEHIFGILERVSKTAPFIKPRLNMLKAYIKIVHGRILSAMRYLRNGTKYAMDQGNILMLALIRQNKRTWTLQQFNNMEQYWVEHVGCNDVCDWQNIDCFSMKVWSSTLYSIPVPDTCL